MSLYPLLLQFGRCGSLPIRAQEKAFFISAEGETMNEIETKFSETLNAVLERGFVIIQDHRCEITKEEDWYNIIYAKNNLCLQIEAQPKDNVFNGYIPDFAIFINGLYKGFIIEIDGHEWHEKTKEQARADKEKERMYLKNGFIPVRFTGSEVYHNTKKCVDELFEIIVANADNFKMEM